MPDFLLNFVLDIGESPLKALWWIFTRVGIYPLYILFVVGCFTGWRTWVQEKFKHSWKIVTLEIQVPPKSEQSMRAVENIFYEIYGAADYEDWEVRWWEGWIQEPFSFEIVGNGGYISYYIRCLDYFRDLVESAVYSQYPDATITEVEDYSRKTTVEQVREGSVNLYGAEMLLTNPEYYPIRRYSELEHSLTAKFIDPLSSLLEIMASLNPGEQIWYQIMGMPEKSDHWKKEGEEAINKIAGKKKKEKTSLFSKILDIPLKVLEMIDVGIFGAEFSHHEPDTSPPSKVLYLTEPEKLLISAIDAKTSKHGYRVKTRFVYVGNKKAFNKYKGVKTMIGFFQHFKGPNSFKAGAKSKTKVKDFRRFFGVWKRSIIKQKKVKLLRGYQSLDPERGENEGKILNTEELATLYHFPGIDLRVPFLHQSETKRVEPPHQLTFESEDEEAEGPVVRREKMRSPVQVRRAETPSEGTPRESVQRGEPPANLPIV